MSFEKLRKWTYGLFFALGGALAVYLFMRYLCFSLLPFLIAWFIAFAMRPLAAYLSPRMRIRPNILRVMLTVSATAVIIVAIGAGIWGLSREIWKLVSSIGDRNFALYDTISSFFASDGFLGRILGEFGSYVTDGIYRLAMSLISSLAGTVSSLAMLIPRALFFALVTVIAAVYFALDLELVNSCVKSIMPERVYSAAVRLKNGFLTAFMRYIRSYLILLIITFFEILLGLALLRAPYPLLMAGVIALLDLLPVIGVGTVLIPWSVWAFLIGNVGFGVGLIVLFIAHTVIRQIIEPKIIGKNLGVHPLLSLILVYVGYSLFGFLGLALVPALTALVNVAFRKEDAAEIDER